MVSTNMKNHNNNDSGNKDALRQLSNKGSRSSQQHVLYCNNSAVFFV